MIMSLLGVLHTTPSGLLQCLPLKHICLNLPTLDLALSTTNLLTDMSHEDAWWFLALDFRYQSSLTSPQSFIQPSCLA